MSYLTDEELTESLFKFIFQAGFLIFITIVLAALKLFSVVTWSWWIIMIPAIYLGSIIVFMILGAAALTCIKYHRH